MVMLQLSDIPHMAALVANMDEGLIVYNDDGCVVYKNPIGEYILSGMADVANAIERVTEWQTEGGTQYKAVLYVFPE